MPLDLSKELKPIRCVDVVLATLQATFSQSKFTGQDNPFLFNAASPQTSPVWICADESTYTERDGNRGLITVSRGDVVPSELHLHNRGGFTREGKEIFMDLLTIPVFVRCQHGRAQMSEVLASMVYSALKFFRRDIMRDFDVHNFVVTSISPAVKVQDAAGSPYVTTVGIRMELQERIEAFDLTNDLNKVKIREYYNDRVSATDLTIITNE